MEDIKTLEKRIRSLEKENKELKKENERLKDKLSFKKNSGRKKIKFKESDLEIIKLYRLQGYTVRELANLYNCSIGLMHKTIKENNLEMRSNRSCR